MTSNNIDEATLAEQLCYIPCNFCNIVLAVSVPCSKLFEIIKVRCEHCTNLCLVNMSMVASQDSSSSSSSLLDDQVLKNTSTDFRVDLDSFSRCIPMQPSSSVVINDQKTINYPLEKRKRMPSAYNQFIKQEIQRIKANNPNINHREAFSAAAKNWAHFPNIQMLEANNHQAKLDEKSCAQGSDKRLKSTSE